MSRLTMPPRSSLRSFPRVSGDEPMPVSPAQERTMFSPRERG